jgi:hypothetical protein
MPNLYCICNPNKKFSRATTLRIHQKKCKVYLLNKDEQKVPDLVSAPDDSSEESNTEGSEETVVENEHPANEGAQSNIHKYMWFANEYDQKQMTGSNKFLLGQFEDNQEGAGFICGTAGYGGQICMLTDEDVQECKRRNLPYAIIPNNQIIGQVQEKTKSIQLKSSDQIQYEQEYYDADGWQNSEWFRMYDHPLGEKKFECFMCHEPLNDLSILKLAEHCKRCQIKIHEIGAKYNEKYLFEKIEKFAPRLFNSKYKPDS